MNNLISVVNVLLCCPLLSPQIVGATVVAPLTVKVSIQVPAVGWAVAKVIKSNLKENEIKSNKFILDDDILSDSEQED